MRLWPIKSSPPAASPWAVQRASLLERLEASKQRVVAVIGPAGCGKTTLLAQLAATDPSGSSWLTLDRRDNDPYVLFAYLDATVTAASGLGPQRSVTAAETTSLSVGSMVAHLAISLDEFAGPRLLVLDNLELITDRACLDLLSELTRVAPATTRIAIASRGGSALPLSRLVLTGDLLEIEATDLAMDALEAGQLVRAVTGERPDRARVDSLLEETEGWAAGIALLSLAGERGRSGDGPVPDGHATVRDVRRYFREEVLSDRSRSELRFLTQTSILERLSPSLCDAVVGRSGSGRRLSAIAASNGFVVASAGAPGWYRYHSLFQEALRELLEREDGGLVAELHARAVAWYTENGYPVSAVGHAFEAGRLDLAGHLVVGQAAMLQFTGRQATVEDWLARFPEQAFSAAPPLAIIGAWLAATRADDAEASRYADIVEQARIGDTAGDAALGFESARATLMASMVRSGLAEAEAHAERAIELGGTDGVYGPAARVQLALCRFAVGRTQEADAICDEATALATSQRLTGPLVGSLSLKAEVALVAGNESVAQSLAARAWAVAQESAMHDYTDPVLSRSILALLSARRGRRAQAQRELAAMQTLRTNLGSSFPIQSVLQLGGLARALAAVGDDAGAWTIIRDIDAIIASRPDLGALPAHVDSIRKQLRRAKAGAAGPSTLTTAELRVLQYLPTHLSFPEIADRLFVTHSTVKAQARAIYGKLDASTRTEAVSHALDAGLLDPAIRALASVGVGVADADPALDRGGDLLA